MSERCGYAVIDLDGEEGPCDRPASGWRWYQDCDHEDAMLPACDWHSNEGGRRLHNAEAIARLAEESEAGWRREADDLADRLREAEAKLARFEAMGLRAEITEQLGQPAHCKVWQGGRLMFAGRSYSADLTLRAALDPPATDAPYAMPGLGEVGE